MLTTAHIALAIKGRDVIILGLCPALSLAEICIELSKRDKMYKGMEFQIHTMMVDFADPNFVENVMFQMNIAPAPGFQYQLN